MKNNSFLSVKNQLNLIKSGIINIHKESELIQKLILSRKNNKPLIIKIGFDPTSKDLHFGHFSLLKKAKSFQDLGHKVIFLIGDFTAKIGDPSGKKQTRPSLTTKKIKENFKTYKNQIFKILDKKKTEIRFNSEWYSKIKLKKMIHILSKYSITQIIEKEDFKNRLNRKNSIGLHEIIYPIIQAYDSVVLNPDIEIGGSDQLFNLLIGRNLMKKFKMIKQCIITTPLIEGINANFKNGKISGEKMSKSLNNSISLNNSSTEKFGKIMSVCDQLMYKYYNLLLGKNINNNNKFKNIHPMHIKKKLAMKIIRFTNNNKNIIYAYDQFNYLFSKKKNKNIYSNNLPIFRFKKKRKTLIEILISTKICKSNTIARKLIISGAIKINNKKILNAKFSSFNKINVIKIGKKKWIKLITN